MIELSWLHLANPNFQQAVQAIWDCPMLDGATSYTAHRIKLKLEKVDREIRDMRVGLCKKYGMKDANGNVVNDERGYIQFNSPEDQKEFEAEFQKEFTSRKAEIKVSKLNFQTLVGVRGITPRMWEHLEPICDNLPQEEQELEKAVKVTEEANKASS